MEARLRQEVNPKPCRPREESSADERAGGHDGLAVADDRHDALALVVEMFKRLALELVQDVGGGDVAFGERDGRERRQRALVFGRRET